MSVYSAKTGISSILKTFAPAEREKAKNAALNKVRFSMPKQKGLLHAVEVACEQQDFQPVQEFIMFLRESTLGEAEFMDVMVSARKVVNELGPKFNSLVESILSLPWTKRSTEAITAYTEFFIDVMVAHSKYIHFGIQRLISQWLPSDTAAGEWPNGTPSEKIQQELEILHKLLDRILTAVPLAFDVVLEAIESKFPYYKKSSHVVAGYVHNILWLIEYKPIFTEYVLQLVIQKVLILDVNAPRDEIEDVDGDETDDDEKMESEPMFEMDDVLPKQETLEMKHPIANTLDITMIKLFDFLQTKNPNVLNLSDEQRFNKQLEANKFLKILIRTFDEVVLPSHNTHHVQFLVFYFCSIKPAYAEAFLNSLWDKIQNPNTSAVIRQSAVGYLSSFLARAKFLSINNIKIYLKELCNWAHNYIERCDQYRFNGSLKANLVFYSICQAIFYVIAFRSRDLTVDKKSLMFLQSLHLSGLVTCNFNPLRVCLPAVATTFAGVTRTYQLAYCHAILERNARRKLATVYANETATPEETLDTFFPFDPYLLKQSGKQISPIYVKYQASEAEEHTVSHAAVHNLRRKRGDSEMIDDLDVDDFLIADKRQKFQELGKSAEREVQFTYGLSPGFHD